MSVTVSFILVSWNTRELVRSSIASIVDTCADIPYEIILVDNGSRDDTVATVRQVFPVVKVIENGINLGFACAVNNGLRQVAGKYAVLLNTDARLHPHAINQLVEYLDQHPKTAVIGGQLLNENGTRQNSFDSFPCLLTELGNKSLLRWLFPNRFPSKRVVTDTPIEVDSIIGACFVARMQAVQEVGMLDDRFFFFYEETDWCYRFRQAGWRVIHHPTALITHLQGRSAQPVLASARIEYYRSRYRYFEKHFSSATTTLLMVGLLVKLLLNSVSQSIAGVVSSSHRQRARVQWAILRWHLAGRPTSEGLPRN